MREWTENEQHTLDLWVDQCPGLTLEPYGHVATTVYVRTALEREIRITPYTNRIAVLYGKRITLHHGLRAALVHTQTRMGQDMSVALQRLADYSQSNLHYPDPA